ncbi:MAG: PQQ-dependent sugar dehydrogenase [Planctomycetes bacterium]|nr:PQQ-dependent sugar dehydrogenase [Planctomycetota bacterium]
MRRLLSRLLLVALSLSILPAQRFVDEKLVDGFVLPVGFLFTGHERMWVWERSGLIKIVDHGARVTQPLLDIREEVGNWRDFGMLGVAQDPDFDNNGHFYCAYIVDRHHLLHYGTPAYDPLADDYFTATIVRVTRFTADASNDFRSVVPGSRHVLLGESASTGVPSTYFSHGACSILFGRDGTLLVATGDGAGFLGRDIGSDPTTMFAQGLADGILRPDENIGAFRAQMLESLAGKVLRLDRQTGDGVPSNPFFDPLQPRSSRSRVWALGLRNPCRMAIRPGTGSTDPLAGQPGELWIGDVGASTYEEVSRITGPGQNLGWPMFEGLAANAGFTGDLLANPHAPNPLFGGNCTQSHFRFQDLLRQATTAVPFFPNPCDPLVGIAAGTPTFVHQMPVADWHHHQVDARVPVFLGIDPTFATIGTAPAGVTGTPFVGNASMAGCWHSGQTFPGIPPSYYHADFGGGWIKRFEFDTQDQLLGIHHFATVDSPLMLAEHPHDHSLCYVAYRQNSIRQIRWVPQPPPIPIATTDVRYGPSTLEVQLDARESYDPEGQPISFRWDLGHGRSSTAPQLSHKLTGPGTPSLQHVHLTVTDSTGVAATTDVPIWLDNTPPRVTITSIQDGDTYDRANPTTVPLVADVFDAESPASACTYAWRTTLLHHNHEHPEPDDNNPVTTTLLTPTPHDDEFYAWRIELTVTDPAGLATTARVFLFPDTSTATTSVLLTSPQPDDVVAVGAPVQFSAIQTGPVWRVEYYIDGVLVGSAVNPPYAVTWSTPTPGYHTACALAIAADGTSSTSRGTSFTVATNQISKFRIGATDGDAQEPVGAATPADLSSRQLVLGDDGTPWATALRFANLTVPPGAQVQNAWIEFTAAADHGDPAAFDITVEPAAWTAPLRATIGNIDQRPNSAPIPWAPGAWTLGASGQEQRTPDLAALLAPIVSAGKWTRSLVFMFAGTGQRRAVAWDGNGRTAALLTIAWQPPAPNSTSLAVTTSADDATETLASGAVDRGNPNLRLGAEGGVPRLIGLRWALPIPPGATLESARLQFHSTAPQVLQSRLVIHAEATDDAAVLTGVPFELSSRTRGPEQVVWTPAGWPASGLAPQSVDCKDVLQPLLQRPGWRQGNRVLLLIDGTGTRTARSFNGLAAEAPRLLLTWRLPAK